jgi:virginiamycin B lyase
VRVRWLAAALVAALTACSSANTASLPNAPGQTVKAPGHGSKHRMKATIRITIPKRKHHRRVKIHGHYISPATQSIEIETTLTGDAPVQANANLTPANNPGCTASLVSTLICTVTLSLEPGAYTGTFTTFDGPLSGGGGASDPATGNQLSAAQSVPFTIAAGQSNQINISLDGIPTAAAIVPAANSSLNGNMANGFTATKCGTDSPNSEKVNVFGIDADQNLIIGPGAPQVQLESSNPGLMAVASPSPQSPNTFTLSHPISNSSQAPVSLTATVTPSASSGGTTQVTGTNVAVSGGSGICGFITEYSVPGQSDPAGITTGSDGVMYFADINDKLGSVTTAGVITEQATLANSSPLNPAADASGNIWFTEAAGPLGERTSAGAIVQHATGLNNQDLPSGITVSSTGIPWFTEQGASKIANLTGATLNELPLILNGNNPAGITFGPDGNLWFAEQNDYIGRMTTAGVLDEFLTTGSPQDVVTGANGNLWVTELGLSKGVGQITTAGVITEYAIPTSTGSPWGITLGSDGNVWFAENTANKIASVTTDGVVHEFSIPTPNSGPHGITAGPDGNLWFTECNAGKIGKVQ